jgi:hypothetical protein
MCIREETPRRLWENACSPLYSGLVLVNRQYWR